MYCASCNRQLNTELRSRVPCGHQMCDFCLTTPECMTCKVSDHQQQQQQNNIPRPQTVNIDDRFSSKIYVANIPFTTTKEELRRMFAICGTIKEVSVHPFRDYQNKERSYGFVTFEDPSAARTAAVFNEKIYKNHVIRVINDKLANYAIFVKNINPLVDENRLRMFFEGYGPVRSVKRNSPDSAFVNFSNEATRMLVFRNQPIIMPGIGPLIIQLKEPNNKIDFTVPPQAQQFSVFVANIPIRVSKEELKTMFSLFGPIDSTHVIQKGSRHTFGFVNFSTPEGREAAMKFHGERPDGWELAIALSDQDRKEKNGPHGGISMGPPPPFYPGSNRFDSVAEPTPFTERPAQIDRRFAVRVTGFGNEIQEKDLREYFHDAGKILLCTIKTGAAGDRYAFINYDSEDAVKKAIEYSDCFIGRPSKQLTVERPIQKPSRTSTSTSSSVSNLQKSDEQLCRATSQMSLSGKQTYRVVVDNVPQHLTSANIQSLFADCGPIASPPEIIVGTAANMAKVFFTMPDSAEKAKQKLIAGAGGYPMTFM